MSALPAPKTLTRAILAPAIAVLLGTPASQAQTPAPDISVQQKRVHFDEMDLGADGWIAAEEMLEWRVDKFRSRDINGDVAITREELMTTALDQARGLTWDEASNFLFTYDQDRDSRITMDEVRYVVSNMLFFQKLDTDGSGYLDRTEASPVMDVDIPSDRSPRQ